MRRLAVALLLSISPLHATPIAEVICAPTAEMENRLVGPFGAVRTGLGVRNPEQVMELWTDGQGDWTLVVRYASGTSCIVAMGEEWTATAAAKPS